MSKQRAQPGAAQSATPEAQAERAPSAGRGNAAMADRLRARGAKGEGAARPAGELSLLGQRFPSLQAVHDWVVAESQKPGSTVPHEPVLRVEFTPGSIIHQRAPVRWTHYSPNQKLVLQGNGAIVSGLRGGRPTPGYFLSYRPVVGAESSAAAPAAANFELRGLTIRGYESGGVEISPQTAPGDGHKWDGGYAAFLDGAVIERNRFEQLGSKNSKPGAADWRSGRFGAGGVVARGLSGSSINHNRFDHLENGPVKGTNVGERLIHAVYLRDQSRGNEVRDNTMKHVSGDPIRVSNASDNNVVRGNKSRDAGVATLVSEFYNPTEGERDSVGTQVGGNDIGGLYGRPKVKAKKMVEKVSRKARDVQPD